MDYSQSSSMHLILDIVVVFFFTIGNYLNYIDRSMTNTFLPEFGKEFNLTKTEQAVISTSYLGGYVLFSFIFCILAHKFKTTILVMFGCILWCLSCVLMFFADKHWLLAGRVLSGVGEGAYQSLVPAFIETYLSPKYTSIFIGVYFSGIYIGSAMGIAFGGLAVKSWRWAYLVELCCMAANVIFLLVFSFFEKSKQVELSCHKFKIILLDIVTTKAWWLVVISYAFFSFTVGAVNTWLPSLVADRFPLQDFTTLQLDLGITVMISSLLGAVISGVGLQKCLDKFPHRHYCLQSGSVIATLGLALIPTYIAISCSIQWPFFLSCIFVLLMLITMTTLPINMLLLQLVDPDSKTYSMALSIAVIHLIGDIPSPILIGKIWDWTQNSTISMELSTIGFIVSILLFIPICLLSYQKDIHAQEVESIRLLDSNSESDSDEHQSSLQEPLTARSVDC